MTSVAPMYCMRVYDALRRTRLMIILIGIVAWDNKMSSDPEAILVTANVCMMLANPSKKPITIYLNCGTVLRSSDSLPSITIGIMYANDVGMNMNVVYRLRK
eukprot:CAMPEP_0113685740 /NCGR_PEP_ID=MMETSP0038_2-20120614/14862_1 /TAXON_ID=2898 /ORGANISM="Cryptomonas paramecium" /LENGTH=101 /DNA_ID=CAMNT_0000605905 /DNA_START=50 /DNA_END=355 /DNA_ORIENTATION=+ /assembly_acc=CAM_ASM_000170